MTFFLIVAFIILGLIDIPRLVEQKWRKELVGLILLLVLTLGMSLMYAWGIKIPSPIKGAAFIIREVLHLGYPME